MDPAEPLSVGIIGTGSVGCAIAVLVSQQDDLSLYTYDWATHNNFHHWPRHVDVCHYTVPCVFPASWASTFFEYMEQVRPKNIIIDATITPNVVDYLEQFQIKANIYVSPVRATEAIMAEQVAAKPKYYAPIQEPLKTEIYIGKYLDRLFPGVVKFADPKALILGKLFETTQFGANIALVSEFARICEYHKISFLEAYQMYMGDTEWRADYTSASNWEFIPRPLFRPGHIGGKCVMQNIELLQQNVSGFDGLCEWIKMVNNHKRD